MNELDRRALQETPKALDEIFRESESRILGALALSPDSPQAIGRRSETYHANFDFLFAFADLLPKTYGKQDFFLTDNPLIVRAIQSNSAWSYYSGPKPKQKRSFLLSKPKIDNVPAKDESYSHFYIFGHNLQNSSLLLLDKPWGSPRLSIVPVDDAEMNQAQNLPSLTHAEFTDEELRELYYDGRTGYYYPPDNLKGKDLFKIGGKAERSLRIKNYTHNENAYMYQHISDDDLIKYHIPDHLRQLATAFNLGNELSRLVGKLEEHRSVINNSEQ